MSRLMKHPNDVKQPKRYPRWPLAIIGLPAFVAVWSGWTSLGQLCGFGIVHPLPGIWDSFAINTAITLPIGIEAYAAYAIGAWLSYGTPTKAKRFAKWSAIGSFVIGALGQISYHLLAAEHATHAPWPITVAVASLPVVTFALATTLSHLMRHDDEEGQDVTNSDEAVEATYSEVNASMWDNTREDVNEASRPSLSRTEARQEVSEDDVTEGTPASPLPHMPTNLDEAIESAYRASVQGGHPRSANNLVTSFGATRTSVRKIMTKVDAELAA